MRKEKYNADRDEGGCNEEMFTWKREIKRAKKNRNLMKKARQEIRKKKGEEEEM